MTQGKTMKTEDLIDEAVSLPVEERALVVDILLRSLNRSDPAVDAQWGEEAVRRLGELRSGAVEPVPGKEVFAKIWKRLGE